MKVRGTGPGYDVANCGRDERREGEQNFLHGARSRARIAKREVRVLLFIASLYLVLPHNPIRQIPTWCQYHSDDAD